MNLKPNRATDLSILTAPSRMADQIVDVYLRNAGPVADDAERLRAAVENHHAVCVVPTGCLNDENEFDDPDDLVGFIARETFPVSHRGPHGRIYADTLDLTRTFAAFLKPDFRLIDLASKLLAIATTDASLDTPSGTPRTVYGTFSRNDHVKRALNVAGYWVTDPDVAEVRELEEPAHFAGWAENRLPSRDLYRLGIFSSRSLLQSTVIYADLIVHGVSLINEQRIGYVDVSEGNNEMIKLVIAIARRVSLLVA